MKDLTPPIEPGANFIWEYNHDMTDEFVAEGLSTIWTPHHPNWLGRAPSFFREDNVKVDAEQRCLLMQAKEDRVEYVHSSKRRAKLMRWNSRVCRRNANLPPEQRAYTYRDFSSSFVRTRTKQKYGYFEIQCKLADSNISSAFWFAADENNSDRIGSWWTEIDVFEYSTSTKRGVNQASIINTNAHVHRFGNDLGRPHRYAPQPYDTGIDLSNGIHTFALDWTPDYIRWYFDGKLLRHAANDYFHRPLYLKLDREAFPYWFGLPEKGDNKLPNDFQVFYVRSWRRVPATAALRPTKPPSSNVGDSKQQHPGADDICLPEISTVNKEKTAVLPPLSEDELKKVVQSPVVDEVKYVVQPPVEDEVKNVEPSPVEDEVKKVMPPLVEDELKKNVQPSLEKEVKKKVQPKASQPTRAIGLAIVAAMVNAEGSELENEWVTLANFTGEEVDLTGWTLSDRIRPKKVLCGELRSGDTMRIANLKVATERTGVLLNNRRGSLDLCDPYGNVVDTVCWTTRTQRIEEGVPVVFHGASNDNSGAGQACAKVEREQEPIVRIVAALPNAPGDENGEWVCVLNCGSEIVDLAGWALSDCTYRTPWPLKGVLEPGESWTGRGMRAKQTGPSVQLSNRRGAIALIDDDGIEVHKVIYAAKRKFKEGRPITFELGSKLETETSEEL